jgi:molecular chaperone DnaK
MLKVSAREKATGLQKQIAIDNALERFEREEIADARDRLDDLWSGSFGNGEASHSPVALDDAGGAMPELAPGPREGQRETVQAQALLEKTERLLPRVQPEDRTELERMMAKMRSALGGREWELLAAAANELADALFYLEDA